jgi:hypothetical protein
MQEDANSPRDLADQLAEGLRAFAADQADGPRDLLASEIPNFELTRSTFRRPRRANRPPPIHRSRLP